MHRSYPVHGKQTQTQPLEDSSKLRCSIISILGWEWQRGMSIPQRQASDHLLVFIKSGTLQAHINQHSYTAHKNQGIWIAKHSRRRLEALKDADFIAAHIDYLPDHQCHIHCTDPLIKNFNDWGELHAIAAHPSHAATYFMHFFNRRLLAGQLHCKKIAVNDPVIQEALLLLDKNPHFSTEQCASRMKLGITRFRQRFKLACAMTPGKYITNLRVSKAAQLLRESDLSIADISLQCGFENANYLYRVFKDVYHCTPNAYRHGQAHDI